MNILGFLKEIYDRGRSAIDRRYRAQLEASYVAKYNAKYLVEFREKHPEFLGPGLKQIKNKQLWVIKKYTEAKRKAEDSNTRMILDLKNIDLKGVDLSEIKDWGNITFINTSFERVIFSRADFRGSNFVQSAWFRGANLNKCSFKGVDLRGGHFEGAKGTNVDFSESMIGGASFEKANITYSKFNHLKREENDPFTIFKGANLVETDFLESQLYADFFGADLSRANFIGTDTSRALGSPETILERTVFRKSDIKTLFPSSSPSLLARLRKRLGK